MANLPIRGSFLTVRMNDVNPFCLIVVGRDGLTHNMLNDIHNNWKSCEAVRVKCLGVPTVDMQNVCHQVEVGICLLSVSVTI